MKIKKINVNDPEFQKIIKEVALKFNAKVTKEQLSKFADLIDRDIKELGDIKDTEDYNHNIMSLIINRAAFIFSSAGQSNSKAGDMVEAQIMEKSARKIKNSNSKIKSLSRIGVYTSGFVPFEKDQLLRNRQFQYNYEMEIELKDRYFLQTEASDSFNSLFERVKKTLPKLMKKQDWKILEECIFEAEQRLHSKTYKFVSPSIHSSNKDEVYQLTKEEKETFGFLEERHYFYSIKKDDHDLLAMKDLVLILENKKKIDGMSITPAFFAKYIPELNKRGINSVIITTHKDSITKINLHRGENTEYSPFTAGKSLMEHLNVLDVPVLNKGKDLDFNFVLDKFNDTKYFVVVDGMVRVPPKDDYSVALLSDLKVDVKLPCAETFIFEKKEDYNNSVFIDSIYPSRLTFTPYDYSKLHLMYQHGGAIYGHNTNAYHSTVNLKLDDITEQEIQTFKDDIDYDYAVYNKRSEKKFKQRKEYLFQEPSLLASIAAYRNEAKIFNFYWDEAWHWDGAIKYNLLCIYSTSRSAIKLMAKRYKMKNIDLVCEFMKNIATLQDKFDHLTYQQEYSLSNRNASLWYQKYQLNIWQSIALFGYDMEVSIDPNNPREWKFNTGRGMKMIQEIQEKWAKQDLAKLKN